MLNIVSKKVLNHPADKNHIKIKKNFFFKKPSKIFGGFNFLYYICIKKQKQQNYDSKREKRLYPQIG